MAEEKVEDKKAAEPKPAKGKGVLYSWFTLERKFKFAQLCLIGLVVLACFGKADAVVVGGIVALSGTFFGGNYGEHMAKKGQKVEEPAQ